MTGSPGDGLGRVAVDGTVSALILAGGLGQRIGGRPKALLEVDGETLVQRVVSQAKVHVTQVIVGLPPELVETGEKILGESALVTRGGETRQATFRNALTLSTGEIVVVHDVARPFTSSRLWDSVIAAARDHGAAAPVVSLPVRDSLAMRDGDWLGAPVDREALVSIQTPYAFRRSVLDRAIAAADAGDWSETSVTTLVTSSGQPVFLVPGEPENTKVTFEADWDDARRRMPPSRS